MRCSIYIAGAGGETPEEAGWSFVVTEQVQLTGSAIIHYCGCTKATKQTVLAMAALQAFYWLKEAKITDYAIIARSYNPQEEIFTSSLSKYLAEFPKDKVVKMNKYGNTFSELAESLAVKAMYRVMSPFVLAYSDIDVADSIVKKESLFSQRYIVLFKTETSNLVALKNMSTAGKKIEVWSEEDFNKGGFIKL